MSEEIRKASVEKMGKEAGEDFYLWLKKTCPGRHYIEKIDETNFEKKAAKEEYAKLKDDARYSFEYQKIQFIAIKLTKSYRTIERWINEE
jgi:uncharacterized protein involved in tolerance to divalent cations